VRLFPESVQPDAKLLVCAKGLRAVADGFVSILLPAYLVALGHDAVEVGLLITATLLGSAAATLLVGLITTRFGYRRLLLAASALMVGTGLGFAGLQGFVPLLVVGFLGTLNPAAGDVSVFVPLEQSMLARLVADKDRTALFARYSLAGSLMGACGTLLAALPELAGARLGLSTVGAMQVMFVAYAIIGIGAGAIYARVTPPDPGATPEKRAPLGPSRGIVYRLSALFCVDSFGSGFFAQSILVLWLLDRFDLPVIQTAPIFFWSNLLTAVSFLAAVPLSRRIGLINTMVFTHIPANLALVAIPFVDDLAVVVALLLFRALLSQMDVPPRASYVMAVVTAAERPAAASVTNVPRSLAAAISPAIGGWMLNLTPFGWPLIVGGALKVAYDLGLLFMFRNVKPPEERRPEQIKRP
jgi:MFS family permease